MLFVTLRNAVGNEQVVKVFATTDFAASNAALKQAHGDDWMVVRVTTWHPDALIS